MRIAEINVAKPTELEKRYAKIIPEVIENKYPYSFLNKFLSTILSDILV